MRVEEEVALPKVRHELPNEELLEFAKGNLPKRKIGRISRELVKASLLSGSTMADAGRFAGSLADNPSGVVSAVLAKEPELREEITSVLDEKIEMLLDNLHEDEVVGRGCGEITVSVERLTKVKHLVEGKSTENLAVRIMGFKDSYALER